MHIHPPGFCPLGGLHMILPLPILYGKYCKEGRGETLHQVNPMYIYIYLYIRANPLA